MSITVNDKIIYILMNILTHFLESNTLMMLGILYVIMHKKKGY